MMIMMMHLSLTEIIRGREFAVVKSQSRRHINSPQYTKDQAAFQVEGFFKQIGAETSWLCQPTN